VACLAEPTLRSGFPSTGGPRSSLDRVRDAVAGAGLAITSPRRDEFKASCPAHDDPGPSLNVTWDASSGKTLVHCHAGCEGPDVISALGLTWADLFDERLPPRERWSGRVGRSPAQRAAGKRRGRLGPLPKRLTKPPQPDLDLDWVEIERYVYVDTEEQPVQAVIRQECTVDGERRKNFVQVFRTPGGAHEWESKRPSGFTPVLYRTPRVREAVRAGQPVYVLEGEKDVHTAESLGVVATTNTQGGRAFPDALLGELAGAHVIVVMDRDGTGYARGADLHEKLTGVGATVQLMLPATEDAKSDLTDHVEAGFSLEDLIEVNYDQAAAWAHLAKLENKHNKGVLVADAEARARGELVEAGVDVEDNQRFAQRWVLESEICVEAMVEHAATVRGFAERAQTFWTGEAAAEADRLVSEARTLARRLHTDFAMPVPEVLLRTSAEASTTAEEAGRVDSVALDGAVTGSGAEVRSTESSKVSLAPETDGSQSSAGAHEGSSVFRVADGKIVQWVPARSSRRRGDSDDEREEGELKTLLSMVVRVTAREYFEGEEEDEVEHAELLGRATPARKKVLRPRTLVAVRLQYTDPASGELMEIRVMADQWRDHSWLESLPDHPDYDHKRAGLDTLQRAVLAISPKVVDEVLHRSTGWRRNPDGTHRFIHARGAITAQGHQDVEVSLTGPLGRFDLPDPVKDPLVLRQAWQDCSETMLERFPGRVAAPLLGHVFRAVLGPNPWNIALIGSPGSYKTSLASKAMHHFGERWEHTEPLTSMSGNGATFNALRMTLYKAKDALAWLDDFAPTKSWLDAQKLLEETSRLIHNRESRPRSSRDGQEVMPGTAPRTSGLFTSEVMPRPGSSGGERMLVVPMLRDEIALPDLIELDEPLSRHGRALVMASYISWLAEDFTAKRDRYMDVAKQYAGLLTEQEGETVRQASAIAHSWVGWVAVTDFLVAVDAMSPEERTVLLQRVDGHLREAGKAAVDPDIPRTTGARVRELLGYALRQGIAHVDDVRDGNNPPWPLASRLGWRRTSLTEANEAENIPAKYRLDRMGTPMGFVLHDPGSKDTRGKVLICTPAQIEAVIKAAAATQVEKLEIDWKTASRALYDEGTLLADTTSEPGRLRLTLKCRIHAQKRDARMAVLRLEHIIGDDLDPDDDALEDTFGPDLTDPSAADGPPVADPTPSYLPGLDPEESVSGTQTLDTSEAAVQDQGGATADHRDQDGSNQPDEENTMTDLRIIPDRKTGTCVECGKPTRTALGDQPVHEACWQKLVDFGLTADPPPASVASAAVVESPAPQAEAAAATAAPAAAEAAPSEPAPTQEENTAQPAPRGRRGPTKAKVNDFKASAVVVDPEGMYLSNGERLDYPATDPTHVGQLAAWAWKHVLGTQTTPYLAESGQVWITEAMARRLGIDVDAIHAAGATEKDEVAREITETCPAVTGALAAGFVFGAESKGLGKWTRIWRPDLKENKAVWLVLLPALDVAGEGIGFMNGDPDPAAIARRIGLFSKELSHPYHLNASMTGLDLLFALRRKEHDKFFRVVDAVKPAEWASETDMDWCRRPTGEELEHEWVHAYDRSGSYLAGMAGLDLGLGDPTHHPDGLAFSAQMPGYWLIDVPEDGDLRVPGPLNWNTKNAGTTRWVTTPTLQFAKEQEYEPKILEAYTWSERARVLDPWYERLRDARSKLIEMIKNARTARERADAQAALDQLKMVYALSVGMMGSFTHREGMEGFRPDWRHHVVAKSRVNVQRRVMRIGNETGRWPVAIQTDTVLYTSSEADPDKAWPGGKDWYGRALGQYKPEGTAKLKDHLKYLDGGPYRGKDFIVPRKRGAE
jgi:hypothetical protein